MLYRYDEAIRDNIKKVFSSIYLAERTQLYKKIRNQEGSNGNIKLPLIGLWRIENTLESNTSKYVEFNTGYFNGKVVDDESKLQILHGINIPLTYQLDILAGSQRDCDDLLTDTIVYLKENPMITFQMSGVELEFVVELLDLSISTDFGSFSDSGSIYSATLTLTVSEARIIYSHEKRFFGHKEIIV